MLQIRIGTRRSRLALAQTEIVGRELRRLHPGVRIEVQEIVTMGDRLQGSLDPWDGKGVFVKELEEALLDGRVDLAVHSLKDMPTTLPPGLEMGAFLPRSDPRDCLVSRGEAFASLPSRSRVATGSLRRTIQLLRLRSDLEIVPIRGNVDTRVRKVDEGVVDAVVLAAAGLERLGLQDRIRDFFDTGAIVPQAGQGVIAVEVREGDREIVAPLDHLETRSVARAETAVLRALGGGCRLPITAYARWEGSMLVVDGVVASPDGERFLKDRVTGRDVDPDELGRRLADRLAALGAKELIHAD